MLAGMRSCFLLFLLMVFSVAACLPVQAQTNGVPASVTSMNGVAPSVTSIGFGGRFINGVSPSVTSLGPNGYGNNWPIFGNCCANVFLPENPNPPLSSGRHHHHRKYRDRADLVGVLEPAYIPYAVPDLEEDVQEADDDSAAVVDYVHAPSARNSGARNPGARNSGARNPGAPNDDPSTKRAGDRDSALQADASANPSPDEPAEPVAAQPPTVLIFKDGHKSDVLNYAIVGDTLFDFADGHTRKILLADLDLSATHKANDDRGVDFQIPANTARQ
jgi:hypothetical protein